MAEILISNRMTSTYDLKGYGDSDLGFQVVSGKYEESLLDFDIAIRGNAVSERIFNLTVQFSQNNDLFFEVQPRIYNDVDFEVFVNPHNKMTATYELLEAPNEIIEVLPVIDTFIASNSPYNVLNYGTNNTLVVGNGDLGEAISFVKFDLSNLPQNVSITNATVKFSYSRYENQTVAISRIIGEWQEESLTYNNNITSLMDLNYPMVVDEINRIIEFDVTALVKDWYLGVPNNGLALTSQDVNLYLRSRETAIPPKLEIQYYSQLPYIVNSNRLNFDIVAKQKEDSDLLFDVDIKSYLMTSESLFTVHSINRNKINEDYSEFDFEIEVTEYSDNSDLDFEIKVVRDDSNSLDFEIEVPEYNAESDLYFNVSIIVESDTTLDFEVEVNEYESNSNLSFNIGVLGYTDDTLDFVVEVPEYFSEDILEFAILVVRDTENYLDFEVEVSSYESDSNLDFELVVLKNNYSEIEFEVEVMQYYGELDLVFDLTVIGIYTDDSNDLSFEVEVPEYNAENELEFEIEILARRDYSETYFQIGVLDYDSTELAFNVNPRLMMINQVDFDIEITAKSTNKIYVYLV